MFFILFLVPDTINAFMVFFFHFKYKTGDKCKDYMCTQIKGFNSHFNTVFANL